DPRHRNAEYRDGDRDDRDEQTQFLVRQMPFGPHVWEHRKDDLSIDIVDDHQGDGHRVGKPGGFAPEQEAVRALALRRLRMCIHERILGADWVICYGISTVAPVVLRSEEHT